jgi:hypothetical protein
MIRLNFHQRRIMNHLLQRIFFSGSIAAGLLASATANTVPLVAIQANNSATELQAAFLANGLQSATLQRGAGLVARTDFPGSFDSQNWSMATTFPGIADAHFLSFTVTLAPLASAVFDNLQIAYQDAGSNESARRLELRWSVDGFADPLFTDFAVTAYPAEDINSVVLPAHAPVSGSVEFRLYGYGAPSTNGVLGLLNSAMIQVDSEAAAIALEGEMITVPESRAFTLWTAFFVGAAVVWRVLRNRRMRLNIG